MQYFLLNAILLPAALFYHSGHSKLDHLEARGNHLQEMLPLKGPWAVKPLSFQKVISPTIIEKLTIEMQQLASEKKKKTRWEIQ